MQPNDTNDLDHGEAAWDVGLKLLLYFIVV